MQSSRIFSLVLVAACLLAVASAASLEHSLKCKLVCDVCKQTVEQLKDNLSQLKPKLEQMCDYCSTPEMAEECKRKIDQEIDRVACKSPEQVCEMIGLCNRATYQNVLTGGL